MFVIPIPPNYLQSIVFEAFEKKRAKRWLPPASETGPGRPDPSVDEDSGGGDRGIEAESALH